MTFEEWTRRCFTTDPRGIVLNGFAIMDEDDSLFSFAENNPLLALEYLASLFEEPISLINNHSQNEIACGLDYICNSCHSNYLTRISDKKIPIDLRRRALSSLLPLYEKLFFPLTSAKFDDTERACDNVCYMLWDLDSLYPPKDDDGLEMYWECARHVLGNALRLPSYTVQKSALHGLGHVGYWMTREIKPLIQPVIETNQLANELADYAVQAINGTVQ